MDAEEALLLCAVTRYDVIVTDVDLPGRSGVDLAREVLRGSRDQRVILCGGHDLREAIDELGPSVTSVPKERADLELPHVLATLEARGVGS